MISEKVSTAISSGNGDSNSNGKAAYEPLRRAKLEPVVLSINLELEESRLKALVRHITHVQQSCSLLGERLISAGDSETGHKLIANGFIHDNSKFRGIEWMYLHDDVKEANTEMFKAAIMQHVYSNPHHPEYWGGVESMPRLYKAEMICDWHARSSEFGTALRDFLKDVSTKKYGFTTQGKVYKELKGLVDLLLDPSF